MPHRPSHAHRPIAAPGHNCWRRVNAERLALLVDGQAYFRTLKAALLEARRSVLIIGWEFDSRTRLERGDGDGGTAQADGPAEVGTIGGLLRSLVRERPALHVHVLVWDSALIYSFDREFLPVVKHDWLSHPRLHFRLDDAHPFGASHHQKIVVIDDRVAFIGGLDISSKRWDSSDHRPRDPRRNDPGYPDYPPFHDTQAMVSGEAAATLGALARHRWRNATGHRLPAPTPDPAHDPWPAAIAPDIEDVMVAFARTAPPWEGEAPVHEIERLFVDMIEAAEQAIYIENQYFASRAVARTLARRLGEDGCPEIALVTSGFSTGFLERTAMGASRARLQARLHAHDRRDRLALYAPVVEERFIKVHAKVLVVDDRLLRIGSANLNNRSMGLDTECDLLLEAAGQDRVAKVIRGFRTRLLAEHLGRAPAEVAERVGALGLHAAIAELGTPARHLVRLEPPPPAQETLPETELFDPEGPVETMLLASAPAPAGEHRPLAARFATGLVLLAGLAMFAALWRWLPHAPWLAFDRTMGTLGALRFHPFAPLLVGGVFLLGGLTGLPVFLLVAAVASVYGAWPGGLYAFFGIVCSAAFTYSVGQAFGRDLVRRITGPRASRISRALVRHGVIAMAMLRVLPVASFTAVNLMAGASRLRRLDYFLGSLVGLLPMTLGFSVFGDRFAAEIDSPDAFNMGLLSVLTLLIALTGFSIYLRLGRTVRGRASPAVPAGVPPVNPGRLPGE